MATYSRVTPATLTNYAAVINDPLDSEAANKLAQVDLQTRRFVYDFLIRFFDAANGDVAKASAIVDATLSGKVKGSTSNSGTQQGIVQGTVSTPDLRDGAVATAKIANDAITTAKIADAQITAAKIAAGIITTALIGNGQITTALLANDAVDATKLKDDNTGVAGAVTADHIRTDAVTTAKIAAAAVTPAKLFVATNIADILVADASKVFQSVPLSGAATISSAGVLTLTTSGLAVIREVAANTVAGGASIAGGAAFATPNVRGVAVAWTKLFETIASMVTIGASGKVTLAAGTYLLEVSSPAFAVGMHIARVARYNSSDVFQEAIECSSEAAPATVQTSSIGFAKMTFAASDYFKIEHWTQGAVATNGLGSPTSAGAAHEVYAQVKVQRLS